MTNLSVREAELARAARRAARIAEVPAATGIEGAEPLPAKPMGVLLSEVMGHGGLYTFLDEKLTHARLAPMLSPPGGGAGGGTLAKVAAFSDSLDKGFFYHLEKSPYPLHARLVSYLSYPGRHLRSPADPAAPGTQPTSPPGKTYTFGNKPSDGIPAAFTFVGQFIDHDLTLNALNLFDPQEGDDVATNASPLLDLDSVFGLRRDEKPHQDQPRVIPRDAAGYLRLRRIRPDGYDLCREDKGRFGEHCSALIGDKRNDENQIIVQIHILLVRLHNALLHWMIERGVANPRTAAQQQTILYWQSFVIHHYLDQICDPQATNAVKVKLQQGTALVNHTFPTVTGPKPRMPHEFAIGFRFGHSQLRSSYKLNGASSDFRLFDSLGNGKDDLQGGKCLDAARLIDWDYFLGTKPDGTYEHPSNLIDTEVNEVVFDLPESTIPDEIKLVSNLVFRNLARSDSLGLCAGEDLAMLYAGTYGNAVAPLLPIEVEPNADYHPLFMLGTNGAFRTPLWYYLLREAECDRMTDPSRGGRLGKLGSLLVAEVILSAIWYSPTSLLNSQTNAVIDVHPDLGTPADISLQKIAAFVRAHDHTPACEGDPCGSDHDCAAGDPPIAPPPAT